MEDFLIAFLPAFIVWSVWFWIAYHHKNKNMMITSSEVCFAYFLLRINYILGIIAIIVFIVTIIVRVTDDKKKPGNTPPTNPSASSSPTGTQSPAPKGYRTEKERLNAYADTYEATGNHLLASFMRNLDTSPTSLYHFYVYCFRQIDNCTDHPLVKGNRKAEIQAFLYAMTKSAYPMFCNDSVAFERDVMATIASLDHGNLNFESVMELCQTRFPLYGSILCETVKAHHTFFAQSDQSESEDLLDNATHAYLALADILMDPSCADDYENSERITPDENTMHEFSTQYRVAWDRINDEISLLMELKSKKS